MSATMQKSSSKHLPLRTLVFAFFVLCVIVLADIFVTSSSRSSILIDESMRVKTDPSNAFGNLMNFQRIQALNGTINGTLLIEPVGKEKLSREGCKLPIDNKVTVKRLKHTSSVTDKKNY